MSTNADGNGVFRVGGTFPTSDAFRVALGNYQAETFTGFTVKRNRRLKKDDKQAETLVSSPLVLTIPVMVRTTGVTP